ncbi:hypothetical protein ATKI12_2683 [Kitasatospora sp. Ki12]
MLAFEIISKASTMFQRSILRGDAETGSIPTASNIAAVLPLFCVGSRSGRLPTQKSSGSTVAEAATGGWGSHPFRGGPAVCSASHRTAPPRPAAIAIAAGR